MRPDKTSSLIRIQTVRHSGGILEIFLKKVDFEQQKQDMKNYPVGYGFKVIYYKHGES